MANSNATTTYLELISKDEKEVKVEGLKIKAQEASIEVQREIMNLNSKIAKTNAALEAAKRQVPYNVKSEYNLTVELENLKKALEFTKNIKKDRFKDVTI